MPSPEAIDLMLDHMGFMELEQFLKLSDEKKATQLAKLPEMVAILNDGHKVILIKGGWRSGKSTLATAYLMTRFWEGERYAIVGVDYELCKEEFVYIREWAEKLNILTYCRERERDQCILELSRGSGLPPARIETKSAKYPRRIAAVPYDGMILCEAAQMDSEILEIAQGRTAQTDGWIILAGTLELSTDWYANKAEEYEIPDNADRGVAYSLPSWVNLSAFPGGKDNPKLLARELSLGHDRFMERYGGETIRPHDLVIKEFRPNIHTGRYPVRDGYPIEVWVDPGYYPSCYAVEFRQIIDDDVYIVDEIFQQRLVTSQICKMVMDKPYFHRIEGGVIDIAGTRHAGAALPAAKEWLQLTKIKLRAKKIPIEDGIDRLRSFLLPDPIHGKPRLHIDKKCRGIISECGGCKSPYEEEGHGSWRYKSTGKPDEKNCDGLKAVIYGIADEFGLFPKQKGKGVSYPETVTA